MTKRNDAWYGWGDDDRSRERLGEPPQPRHIFGAFSCCYFCSETLLPRRRCTTDLEALQDATDNELRTGVVEGCVLDRNDELERRLKERKYGPVPVTTQTRRTGILARMRGTT